MKATIKLKDPKTVIKVRPMKYSPQDRKEFGIQIQELLDMKIIIPNKSPHMSPTFLVENEAEKRRGKKRMVVNYKVINDATIGDNHNLPNKYELLTLILAIQAPLQVKLKKDISWEWKDSDTDYIGKVKWNLKDFSKLYHPESDDKLIIEIDASSEYWGRVLKASKDEAIPEQTAPGKETANPLKVVDLLKIHSEVQTSTMLVQSLDLNLRPNGGIQILTKTKEQSLVTSQEDIRILVLSSTLKKITVTPYTTVSRISTNQEGLQLKNTSWNTGLSEFPKGIREAIKKFKTKCLKNSDKEIFVKIQSTVPFWDEDYGLVKPFHYIQIGIVKEKLYNHSKTMLVSPKKENLQELAFHKYASIMEKVLSLSKEEKIKINYAANNCLITSQSHQKMTTEEKDVFSKIQKKMINGREILGAHYPPLCRNINRIIKKAELNVELLCSFCQNSKERKTAADAKDKSVYSGPSTTEDSTSTVEDKVLWPEIGILLKARSGSRF
ncbi:hypothetical protein AgCh_003722 [Apium graveolens]